MEGRRSAFGALPLSSDGGQMLLLLPELVIEAPRDLVPDPLGFREHFVQSVEYFTQALGRERLTSLWHLWAER
jgi:hypothetical protein